MTTYIELTPVSPTNEFFGTEYSRVRLQLPFLDAGDVDDKIRDASSRLESMLLDRIADQNTMLMVLESDAELRTIATALAREYEMSLIERRDVPANPLIQS